MSAEDRQRRKPIASRRAFLRQEENAFPLQAAGRGGHLGLPAAPGFLLSREVGYVDELLPALDASRLAFAKVLVAGFDVDDPQQLGDGPHLPRGSEGIALPALPLERSRELRRVGAAGECGQRIGAACRLRPSCRRGRLEVVRIGAVLVDRTAGVVERVREDVVVVDEEMEHRPRDARGDGRRDGDVLAVLRRVHRDPSA